MSSYFRAIELSLLRKDPTDIHRFDVVHDIFDCITIRRRRRALVIHPSSPSSPPHGGHTHAINPSPNESKKDLNPNPNPKNE